MEESGDLVIRHVLPTDEGKYQCVAHNMAATRESPAVSLSTYGIYHLTFLHLQRADPIKLVASALPSFQLTLINISFQ